MENVERVNDLVYLRRRATEERVAASGGPSHAVRNIHLELASAYEFRLHVLQEMERLAPAASQAVMGVPTSQPNESSREMHAQLPPLMNWSRRP